MKKTLLSAVAAAVTAVSPLLVASACKQEVATSQQTASQQTASGQRASGQTPAALVASEVAAAEGKIVKVVFVGKKNACDCTRQRVEDSWAALQKALGTPAKLPVQRLQVDTDEAQVAPYGKQKAIMTLPAIYFVDGNATVLALLQGEVTEDQFRSVMK